MGVCVGSGVGVVCGVWWGGVEVGGEGGNVGNRPVAVWWLWGQGRRKGAGRVGKGQGERASQRKAKTRVYVHPVPTNQPTSQPTNQTNCPKIKIGWQVK